MRERLTRQFTLYFSEREAEKIIAEAKRVGVGFSEVVRDCVAHDLPRFRDRHRKRILKRKTGEKSNQA